MRGPAMPDITASKAPRTSAFISYSPKDQRYLQELHSHLAHYIRKENLNVWDDTRIPPGAKWREEIEKALQSAKVAVLLVSADFLASDFIVNNQLPALLTAAKEEGAIIFCVILRPCAFKDTELAQFQAVNDPSKPVGVKSRAQRDEIWNKVAELVWQALSGEKEGSGLTPPSTVAHTLSPSKSTTGTGYPSCDICVICAKDEEVEAFMHEAERLCHTTFQPAIGPRTKRNHCYATIHNNKGELL